MLQASLPESEQRYRRSVGVFGGIDRTRDPDSTALHDARGADLSRAGAVCAAPGWERVYSFPKTLYPQSMSAIGDSLVTFCRRMVATGDRYSQDDHINLVVCGTDDTIYTGAGLSYRESGDTRPLPSDLNLPRSMVQFNRYCSNGRLTDALGGKYDKQLLIFPDKLAVTLPIDANGFSIGRLDADAPLPDLRYATVHAARLFGVDGGRIYASAYNDPTDWDVDTAADIGAANAWAATTGADSRADSDFTAVCACDGGVVAMKSDFGHIVSGERNPFRVRDTDALGTLDARSVVRLGGKLYFTARDGVKCYDGQSVRRLSDPLTLGCWHDGIGGGCGSTYYILEDGVIYTYDIPRGVWSAIDPPAHGTVISFAALGDTLYALTQVSPTDSALWRLSAAPGQWYFETGRYAFSDTDDKRPARLSVVADIPSGGRVRVFLVRDGKSDLLALDSGERTGRVCVRTLLRAGTADAHRLRVVCDGAVSIDTLEYTVRKGGNGHAR